MSRVITILILLATLTVMAEDNKTRARELLKESHLLVRQMWSKGFDPLAPSSPAGRRALLQAIEKLTEAIRLWPEYGDAYAARSSYYGLLRDEAKSRADARMALKYPIESKPLLISVPSAFEGKEKREAIQACIKRVEVGSPFHQLLWGNIAESYFFEGDFKNCIREYELLDAYPFKERIPSHYGMRGMAYEALGDYAKAEKLYRKHLPEATADAIKARMRSGDFEGALTLADKLSLSGDEGLILRTGLQLLSGKPAPALDKALATAHRSEAGYDRFWEGLFLLRNGRRLEGRRMLQSFVDSCEANPKESGVTLRWEIAHAKKLLVEPAK